MVAKQGGIKGGGGGGHISKKLFGCSEVTHVHCHIKGGFVQTIDLSFGVLFLFYFIFIVVLTINYCVFRRCPTKQ